MAGRLGDDARLLGEVRRLGMVEVVGILQRVRQHEGGLQLAIDVDRAVEHLGRRAQRIVAGIEELDLGAEHGRGLLGLLAALRLHVLQPHAGLLPGELALAALAVGQAHDLDAVALAGMQRDRPARPPDEIAWVGGHHEPGFAGQAFLPGNTQPSG